jgi:tetratricopeptide (TPR) repeat protein
VETTWTILQRLIDRNERSANLAREALVGGLLYRHRLADASKQIEAWLKHEPDNTMALLMRGRLNDARFQYTDALEDFRRVLVLDPEHDEVRLRLTTLLIQLSQSEEALPHLEYLRDRLPGNLDVPVQLAKALDLQGQSDEARAVLDECLRRHPNHAAALAERGRFALRDGEPELAEKQLARAVRLDPADASSRHQYYLALNQNGKKDLASREEEAIRRIEADVTRVNDLLKRRLQMVPDDPDALHEVAMITLRAGRPREALRWLQNTLQADPNHVPTHRALAVYYRETGNPILAGHHRAIAQRLGAQKSKSHK